MGDELLGRRVGFVVANEGVEQTDLTSSWAAVLGAGGEPVLIATKPGTIQAFNQLNRSDQFHVDSTSKEVSAKEFNALVLPGGVVNADLLRMDGAAVAFVRDAIDVGIPVGVICHGPWTIIEADRVRGRTLASWPSLQTDIRNGGGSWVDEEVMVCDSGSNIIISSRKSDDLPAFNAKILEIFSLFISASHPSRQSFRSFRSFRSSVRPEVQRS